MTMTDKNEFAAISRREAIGVIAVTSASGAVLTGSHPVVTMAGASVLGAPAAGVAQNADEPTRSPAKLAAEHFEPLIGEKFTIGDDEVTLSEVRHGPESGAQFRQQFALTFDTPRGLPIGGNIMPLSHPAIGRHELHVSGATGQALEICFS
jgi:hypothetical protein